MTTPTSEHAHRPHWVYEMLARDGSHLYVGCTVDIAQRLTNHRATKDWYGEIFRIEVDAFPDMRSALDAERDRIALYQPTYNTIYTDKYDTFKHVETRRRRVSEAHGGQYWCGSSGCQICITAAHAAKVRCEQGWTAQDGCSDCAAYPLASEPDPHGMPQYGPAAHVAIAHEVSR